MKTERRLVTFDSLEFREGDGDSAPVISGHAAVFDSLSENLGGFREQIKSGAFAETIKTADVRALINHDPNMVLGRSRAGQGTLSLKEDKRGLFMETTLPDTSYAQDLRVSMERGDVDQMSFGFSVAPEGQDWGEDEEGELIRTLTRVNLFDVSVVTYPAYPETDAQVRNFEQAMEDMEQYRQAKGQQAASELAKYHHRLTQIRLGDLI